MDDAIEEIEFLARSPTRVRILDELNDESPLTKRELRERLDGTRTTIHRNIEVLCEREWIENGSGNGNREYAITPGGETVVEGFADLAETIQVERRLQPFLRWVDRSDLDIDLRLLGDAELVVAKPGDPWAMVNRHVRSLESMNDARITLPLTGLHAMEVMCERIVREGARCEVVVAPDVAETFQSNPDYAELCEEMADTGRFDVSVYEHEDGVPYYLGVLDGTVQIGVDEDGEPRALLETDSEDVRQWAEEKYEWYEQRAEKIL